MYNKAENQQQKKTKMQ